MSVPRAGRVRYLLNNAFHGMAYTEWGASDAPAVICVHGLTRNGRDFDPLGEALSPRFRVICPDLPGRGASDWLPEGKLYELGSYVHALTHLLAAVGPKVALIGTSLGGILGMVIASLPGQPIERLVLNDVGPAIPGAALNRIRDYMLIEAGQQGISEFADLGELERHLRLIHAPFGALTDAQWANMARHSFRTLPNGRLVAHWDPAIREPMREAELGDVDMWALWEQITVPVLAVHGQDSDVLLPETLDRMLQRRATSSVLVPHAGHAPALMDVPTIDAIERFLTAA